MTPPVKSVKLWWEGSFEERMARRRERRGPKLCAQIDRRDQIQRMRDIWESIKAGVRPKLTIEEQIKKAGGIVLTEPLLDTHGELNPKCTKQLLIELEKP